jgi:AcrR family transcriptional regulator
MPRRDSLTEALLQIVARRGLDSVSVREVATAGGVSIGTVQHHFPTKDDMLAAAFREVVRRIRIRIEAVPLGADVRRNLSRVLRELVPLTELGAVEARVYLAFATRAATAPDLAEIQRTVLTELHAGLTEAFVRAWDGSASPARCRTAAHAVVALADGLALHAVSAGDWLPPRHQTAALELVLDALLPQ